MSTSASPTSPCESPGGGAARGARSGWRGLDAGLHAAGRATGAAARIAARARKPKSEGHTVGHSGPRPRAPPPPGRERGPLPLTARPTASHGRRRGAGRVSAVREGSPARALSRPIGRHRGGVSAGSAQGGRAGARAPRRASLFHGACPALPLLAATRAARAAPHKIVASARAGPRRAPVRPPRPQSPLNTAACRRPPRPLLLLHPPPIRGMAATRRLSGEERGGGGARRRRARPRARRRDDPRPRGPVQNRGGRWRPRRCRCPTDPSFSRPRRHPSGSETVLAPAAPPAAPRARAAAHRGCNCKNSRCLKLYCECFASGKYCEVRRERRGEGERVAASPLASHPPPSSP